MIPVRLSPQAEDDLEAIGDFIAADSPRRAIAFVDELQRMCRSVGHAPEAFPLQPALGAGLRRVVYQRYLIFYKILPGEVRIERILHGARDISPEHFDA